MFCEEIKIPGLPGEGTVTDGSVDWYEMDWENVDNGVTEEQMPRNVDRPCATHKIRARTIPRCRPMMKPMR